MGWFQKLKCWFGFKTSNKEKAIDHAILSLYYFNRMIRDDEYMNNMIIEIEEFNISMILINENKP